MTEKKIVQTNYKHFFGTPEKAARTYMYYLPIGENPILSELRDYIGKNQHSYDVVKLVEDDEYLIGVVVDFLNADRVVEVN